MSEEFRNGLDNGAERSGESSELADMIQRVIEMSADANQDTDETSEYSALSADSESNSDKDENDDTKEDDDDTDVESKVFKATQLIADGLSERKIKHAVHVEPHSSRVLIPIPGDYCGYQIQLINTDDDNDVAARVYNFQTVPEEKTPQMLKLLNSLNCRYRYASFTVDINDNTITISYDMISSCDDKDICECAFEILSRMSDVIDEAYPEIMKLLWG